MYSGIRNAGRCLSAFLGAATIILSGSAFALTTDPICQLIATSDSSDVSIANANYGNIVCTLAPGTDGCLACAVIPRNTTAKSPRYVAVKEGYHFNYYLSVSSDVAVAIHALDRDLHFSDSLHSTNWVAYTDFAQADELKSNISTRTYRGFYAEAIPNNYVIEYELGDGSLESGVTAATFDEAFSVGSPELEDYVFVGWKLSGDNPNYATARWGTSKESVTKPIDEDTICTPGAKGKVWFKNLIAENGGIVTLVAQYERRNVYYIQYDLGGGALDSPPEESGFDAVFAVGSPKLDGYEFVGWRLSGANPSYTDSRWGTSSEAVTNPIGDDTVCTPGSSGKTWFSNLASVRGGSVKLVAEYTRPRYTLTFDPQGGTCEVKARKIAYGDYFGTLPVAKASVLGKRFKGWFTDPYVRAEETPISQTDTYDWETDITVYAHYEDTVIFTISTSAEPATGGTVTGGGKYNKDDMATLTAIPNAGYYFANWKENLDEHPTIQFRVIEDASYVAVFTGGMCQVTFDPGAGITEEHKRLVSIGRPYGELPAVTPPEHNYFVGWFTTPESEEGSQVTAETLVETITDHTLYARYTDNAQYTIAYEGCGADLTKSGPMPNQTCWADENVRLRINAFVRPGYAFAGWATSEDRAAELLIDYVDGAMVRNYAPVGQIGTAYAVWATNSYSVVFDPNGATSGTMDGQLFWYDQTKALASNQFVLANHKFIGWLDEETSNIYDNGASVMNLRSEKDSVCRLVAQWKEDATERSEYSRALQCENLEWNCVWPSKYTKQDDKSKEWVADLEHNEVYQEDDSKYALQAFVQTNGKLSYEVKLQRGVDTETFGLQFWMSEYSGTYFKQDGRVRDLHKDEYDTEGVSEWKHVDILVSGVDAKTGMYLYFCNETSPVDASGESPAGPSCVWIRNMTWTPMGNRSITYSNLRGASNALNPTTYDEGDEFLFKDPTGAVEGHTFAGWDPAGIEKTTTGNVLALASWTPNAYTVHFDANGGVGSMADQPFTYGVSQALSLNAFSNGDRTFLGWRRTDIAADLIEDGALVCNLTAKADAVITLKAEWGEVPHGRKVVVNGVVQEIRYGNTLSLETFASVTNGLTNVVCTGWIGTGSAPASGTSNTVSFVVREDSSLTWLYQTNYWVSVTASPVDAAPSPRQAGSVSLKDAAGVAITNELWAAAGTNLVASATADEGWSFTNWVDAVTGEEVATQPIQAFTVSAPMQVESVFEELPEGRYSILYLETKGCENVNPTSYTAEDEVSFMPLEAPEGWTFVGWEPARIERGSTGTKRVTAKWSQGQHVVTIDGVATNVPHGVTFSCSAVASVTNGMTNVVCIGWTGTGSAPATGVGNKASFVVTEDSALDWVRRNSYWVSVTASSLDAAPSPGQVGGSVVLKDAFGQATDSECWAATGVKLTAEATADAGWAFVSWIDLETGVVITSDSTYSFTVTAPKALRAVFKELPSESYPITYLDTKECANDNPTSYTVEDEIEFKPLEAPEGWTFLGWSPAGIARGSTGAKTVTALWKEDLPGGRAGTPVIVPAQETTLGGAVTWSAKNLPAGMKIAAKDLDDATFGTLAGGTIYGTPTQPGTYVVNVTAKSGTSTETFEVRVSIGNYADETLPLEDAYGVYVVGAKMFLSLGDAFAGCKATGLPAGLKFAANATKDATFGEVAAGTVYGVPTKACTNCVIFTKTASETVGGKSQKVTHTASATFLVAAVPAWAIGTFNGRLDDGSGSVTLTVAATGKASGKIVTLGKTWTFTAAGYDSAVSEGGVIESLVLEATAKSGKLAASVQCTVTCDGATGRLASEEQELDATFTLWRNEWKDKGATDKLKPFVGVYTVQLGCVDSGYGYLSLTVDAKGNCKATGKLPDGTSASATLPLVWQVNEDGEGAPRAIWQVSPSAYKGGYVSGVLVWDGALMVSGDEIAWVSLAPMASDEYGAGFSRIMSASGAWYNKLAALSDYYSESLTFDADAPTLDATVKMTYSDDGKKKTESYTEAFDASVLDCWGSLTVSLDTKGTSFVVDQGAATRPVRDKESQEWLYEGANDAALTMSFTKATGVFKGSFTCWYDYVSAVDETQDPAKETLTHTSKKVSYEGVMVLGNALRGYYLWERTASYEDEKTEKTKTYKYKESRPVTFE